ncbi:YciN family protein [Serratia microhaemolytica]|uniref:YciN family protein n=1 Tax=Serratia microhaemolytica TaxID=2675110 RepID=UPI000FDF3CAE|nr:YciN family protein [Serratia microhaemolytica]
MNSNTQPIQRAALLAEANQMIVQHQNYLPGMQANDVEQKGAVLVFRGELFLDANGLPTQKTTAVFNMFKHLAHQLSEKYHLID